MTFTDTTTFGGRNPAKEGQPVPVRFTIPGCPVGKPRQTQRDKWKQRPCVMAYRAWADEARKAAKQAGLVPRKGPIRLQVTFYLPRPASLSVKKIVALIGTPHVTKPDIDNVLKSLLDALFEHDQAVWSVSAQKVYSDGKQGSRTEVEVT